MQKGLKADAVETRARSFELKICIVSKKHKNDGDVRIVICYAGHGVCVCSATLASATALARISD